LNRLDDFIEFVRGRNEKFSGVGSTSNKSSKSERSLERNSLEDRNLSIERRKVGVEEVLGFVDELLLSERLDLRSSLIAFESSGFGSGSRDSVIGKSFLGIKHVLLELGSSSDGLMTSMHQCLQRGESFTGELISRVEAGEFRDERVERVGSLL